MKGVTNSPFGLCGRKIQTYQRFKRTLIYYDKDTLVSFILVSDLIFFSFFFCGRKATLNSKRTRISELRTCVKVAEVAVLGSPSLIVLMVSVDVKQQGTTSQCRPQFAQGDACWSWNVRVPI